MVSIQHSALSIQRSSLVLSSRSGALSHYQASQLLGISRFEFDGFLKERNVYEHAYDIQDLDRDQETLRSSQRKMS